MSTVPVDPDEKITRYIFDRNKIKWSVPKARHTAFMPRHGCLSVFRMYGLSEHLIWEKGEEVGTVRGRPLLARGDVIAQSVLDTELLIDPDDDPLRHANIVGWPDNESEARLKAIELAEKAMLSLK
jgi:hypothetical protein